MKTKRTAIAAMAALLFAASAGATTITECQGLIGILQTQTVAAIFKSQKDEDGLIAKLKEASAKLDLAKLTDASQKVGDYQSRLGLLNTQGKIVDSTGTVYSELSNSAIGVQTCISSIGK